MPRSPLRRALNCASMLFAASAVMHGCSCSGPVLRGTDAGADGGTCLASAACCSDMDCTSAKKKAGDPNWMNWVCVDPGMADARCSQAMTNCMIDSDCCPGQVCNTTIGLCTDNITQCMPDGGDPTACTAAIPLEGAECVSPLGVFPKSPGCSFQKCMSDADCGGNGLHCFDDFCLGGVPCNGGCGANQVCTPVINSCFNLLDQNGKLSSRFPASCSQTCSPGTILVFKDGTNVFQTCDTSMSALECACEALPPISSNDTARYSSAAIGGNNILVSAYDGQYGDLVMHIFAKDDPNDPKEIANSPIWIDGVPKTGAITGDPNGPRGGISDPGPNVGEYTSIAVDPNSMAIHISYYDVADATGNHTGNLKYARSTDMGKTWTIMIVDGVDSSGNKTADVGLYTSITLSPDGSPVIAYFQQSGLGPMPQQTGLKVARATSAAPMSATDWNFSNVDTVTEAAPACGGSCTSGQQCGTDSANVTQCFATASSCSTNCSSSQFCGTDSTNNASCITSVSAPGNGLAGLPAGTGLFPSITYPPSDWPAAQQLPVVVWYNHDTGTLWGAIATADNDMQGANFAGQNVQLDDGIQTSGLKDDVGQYTSIAFGDMTATNPIAVSYFDSTQFSLMLLTAQAGWMNPTKTVIDNGSSMSGSEDFVGADSSVKFNGDNVWIAYQDSTALALLLANQSSPTDPVMSTNSPLDSGEGCGFYAKLLIDTNSQYVSNAVIKAAMQGNMDVSANQLKVFRVH